ncbi:MAG: hypothetical protein WD066_14625 [Planctomycetaceae bacterium]
MTTVTSAPPSTETASIVVKALDASPEPLKAKQIGEALTGPFRFKPDELQRTLDELVAAKRIHQLPPYQGKVRYWTRSLDEFARTRIRQALDRRPLTRSELKRSVKTSLPGVSEKRQGEILKELEQQGHVHKLPPLLNSRTERFSMRPADPREYVTHALDKLAEKLSKVGIDEQRLRAACREVLDGQATEPAPSTAPPAERPIASATAHAGATAPQTETSVAVDEGNGRPPVPRDDELARLVIERMQAITSASHAALVSITDLRRQPEFDSVEKSTFDRVLLDLGRKERVALHRHDYPMSLDEEERRRFVLDGHGRYYNAVSVRVESRELRVES